MTRRQPLSSAPLQNGGRPPVATQPANAPARLLLKYYDYLVNNQGLSFNEPLEFPLGAGLFNAEDVIQFTTKTTPPVAVLVAKYRSTADMTLGNERFKQFNTDNRKVLQKNNYILMIRGGDEAFYERLTQGLEKFSR
jgi:tRNA U38,U39,U40 pseudouridine synthase TruA